MVKFTINVLDWIGGDDRYPISSNIPKSDTRYLIGRLLVIGSACCYKTLFNVMLSYLLFYPVVFVPLKGGPTIEQRFESYYNYCSIFNYILSECLL